ncbi:hypothetical protein QE422_001696 [Chryseobacterium sp. SORGH_AS 447]|uniref:hypothetical protein n=1 Tax=Chryseobacterium sp. SORGH_AS_0447 TaxID=3041769 RepID=UPI00277EC5A7|nr:hypothetical protein [Chryseobacterium sp. SORGH_AS_0447]MDQ1161328.1 hypothetical protein [Chryseobacterium sp. SORGH_AS_0447]
MDKKLKIFLIRSVVVLSIIHLAYFIYGYFKFEGIHKIDIYTEFYRFKFYDDVSISHFFITGLFLFCFLVLLLRNHSKIGYNMVNKVKIGASVLFISFLSLTFFISYSFGLNAKMRQELPEKDFNKDKTLLNVLNPFLYNYTSYSSEKLFNPENILYPEPYPVIAEKDTTFYDPGNPEYYSIKTTYYSIDTLKILSSDYKNVSSKIMSGMDDLGLDPKALTKRIISKKAIGDSTEIIFKGVEADPEYDEEVCIFLENNILYSPVHQISQTAQQHQNAVTRYRLLYKYDRDSLLHSFQNFDALLTKYQIESEIVPKDLNQDVFYYRDHRNELLNEIRNTFDRAKLKERFKILERLFYNPNYLHPSIQPILILVVLSVWLAIFLLYLIWNYMNTRNRSRSI